MFAMSISPHHHYYLSSAHKSCSAPGHPCAENIVQEWPEGQGAAERDACREGLGAGCATDHPGSTPSRLISTAHAGLQG